MRPAPALQPAGNHDRHHEQQRWDTAAIAKLTANDMTEVLKSVLSETESDAVCQEGFRREGIDGKICLDTLNDCKEMIVDILRSSSCDRPKLTLIKLNAALRDSHPARADSNGDDGWARG